MKRKDETRPEIVIIDDIEVCPHDIAEIKIIESCVTCETTQLICSQCGAELELPKTEC